MIWTLTSTGYKAGYETVYLEMDDGVCFGYPKRSGYVVTTSLGYPEMSLLNTNYNCLNTNYITGNYANSVLIRAVMCLKSDTKLAVNQDGSFSIK